MGGDLIQTPQTRWIQGAYESVQRGTTLTLVGRVRNAALESRYNRLILPAVGTAYQVPTGLTLYITKIQAMASIAGAVWALTSSTADAGNNAVAAPAGLRWELSDSDTFSCPLPLTTSHTPYEFTTLVPIESGRYPNFQFLTSGADLNIVVYGHVE